VFAFETIKIAQPISHEGTENPTSAQRIHADAPASRTAHLDLTCQFVDC